MGIYYKLLNKESIIKWKNIAKFKVIENEEIIQFAENLNKKGIKPKDALHIACAVNSKCEYFLTTDRLLLNKVVPEIRIINPMQFVMEEEENYEK